MLVNGYQKDSLYKIWTPLGVEDFSVFSKTFDFVGAEDLKCLNGLVKDNVCVIRTPKGFFKFERLKDSSHRRICHDGN